MLQNIIGTIRQLLLFFINLAHIRIIQISMLKKILLQLLVLLIFTPLAWAQGTSVHVKQGSDTIVLLNNIALNEESLHISRNVLLEADSLTTNIDSLNIMQYKVRALTLGMADSVFVEGAQVVSGIKKMIVNEQYPYKFIYMEDIILINNKGEVFLVQPNKIKLIFTK